MAEQTKTAMDWPKLYRASTACDVTGIKPVTLRQWHLRGHYTPISERFAEDVEHGWIKDPGSVKAAEEIREAERQGWRLYTFEDIVRLLIIHRLIQLGFAVERAAMIAENVDVANASERFQFLEKARHGKRKRAEKPHPGILAVSFLPNETRLRQAMALSADQTYSREMRVLTDQATFHCYHEGQQELVWAFGPENKKPERYSNSIGLVINASELADEVQQKLAAIESPPT